MTKKNYYPKPNQNLDFAKMEEEILKFWQDEKVFEKSVAQRNFSSALDDDNTSPVQEPCALKNHTHCRHAHEEKSEFVFYDGPPFANGLPHYGHLLTGFIKDLVARYQTMKGKKVERRFGWDTHGLPVEMETEKELTKLEGKSISGQIAIKEYGIQKFNEACEKSVMKYADEWEHYVTRQGRFVDFKNSYKTMDLSYMESVLWAFKQLHEKGLLYEDFRVVPYSWACQTPLSNFETQMDNSYRQKASKAVTVLFTLKQIPNHITNVGYTINILKDAGYEVNSFKLLAWTTTPWTLPSNLALAVGKDIHGYQMYFDLESKSLVLMVCSNSFNQSGFTGFRLETLYPKRFISSVAITSKEMADRNGIPFNDQIGGGSWFMNCVSGKDLLGLKYEPLFPYFNNSEKIKNCDNAFTILHGDFVSADQGTGIVHIAPGFGEDDQLLCKANGIPTICPVDEGGKFTAEIFDLTISELTPSPSRGSQNSAGVLVGDQEQEALEKSKILSLKNRQVFDTNDDIIRYLKATNSWLKTEQILHNYPHCWRTDTPLIYKAVSSWYVKVTAFKDRMVELNQEINWIPSHIKDGQFGKWLENARDWSITRNRFWGCPVPVWKSKSGKIKVFGSIAELEAQVKKCSGKEIKITNLHRPFIDEIKFVEDGEEFTRVSDVLDCWFESGSMPYAQVHYPFENKEWFEENFPADFITEYVAQTRGWFYTLMVLSTALFDRAPFKNVICHGTILDENSQKLSKRLRNYADPLEIFSTIGSDAMRFYMISQPVMRGQELRIDKEGKAIRDTLRLSIKPLMNAFNFFCLYANADGILAKRIELKRDFSNVLDRYILAKLKSSVIKIDQAMSAFDTVIACEEFNKFFEVLNNWYIRRSRQRFWRSCINDKIDEDKQDAYEVLLTVLLTMCEACAPLLPFTCEFVWSSLTKINEKNS